MRVSVLPNTLMFEGVLSEETSLNDLIAGLEGLKKGGVKPPVTLDFSNVTRANSAGIVTWLKFLKSANTPFKYVNAPVWLVRQFNMIKGYFTGDSYVESFQVPMYCPEVQFSKVVTVRLGKEVPILASYANFKFPNQVIEGKTYEIDFDPEQYLSFIAENAMNFKKVLR